MSLGIALRLCSFIWCVIGDCKCLYEYDDNENADEISYNFSEKVLP